MLTTENLNLDVPNENILRDELAQIEQLQRRWLMGSDLALNIEELPVSWQPWFNDQPAERHTLMALALASQYPLLLHYTQQALPELITHAELPHLPYPLLPDSLRPLFCRTLASLNQQQRSLSGLLLHLLAQRGYIAHPADWLPGPQDENLPERYWPWCRWAANALADADDSDKTELSEQNWDEWYPAERLAQLKKLRLNDPNAARALIEACAPRESADKRLRIIQILALQLSQDDAPYLQSLLTDRSQKIAQQASQYLARLGLAKSGQTTKEASDGHTTDLAKELAEGYEVKKAGLLKKRLSLIPKALKSKKQQAVRSEQLEKVVLSEFAAALQLNVSELASTWSFKDNRSHDNRAFINNAVSTLPDTDILVLLESLLTQLPDERDLIYLSQLLLPRLTETRRAELMQQLLNLRKLDFQFSECLHFLDQPLQTFSFADLQATRAWRDLETSLREALKEGGYLDKGATSYELLALGLFLPQATAQQVLPHLYAYGLMPADPVTEALKLNTQLVMAPTESSADSPIRSP